MDEKFSKKIDRTKQKNKRKIRNEKLNKSVKGKVNFLTNILDKAEMILGVEVGRWPRW